MINTLKKGSASEPDPAQTTNSEPAHLKDKGDLRAEGIVLTVPVDKLGDYMGIVSNDIVGKDGAIILPAGVDLRILEPNIGPIIKILKAHGIDKINLRTFSQFSEEDIEKIFEKILSDNPAIASKEDARDVINRVDTLFDAVRKQAFEPEMIAPLANMGSKLTEGILRNPSVAFSLGKVNDADKYTFVHSFNVAVLAGYLTNRLHRGNRDYVQRIVVGALLHDIGKSQIPIQILNKPGPLDPEEFKEMKKHPAMGIEMAIKGGMNDADILEVIGGHHEKWSGKGYPHGKAGLEISEAARISAVADVFDALTAKRVYKNPLPSRDALSLILKDGGEHFDTRIARELLVSLGLYPPGTVVSLSDGSIGLVVSGGGSDLIRPVLMLKENDGKKTKKRGAPTFIDLKKGNNLYIAQHLGHIGKRELALPEKDRQDSGVTRDRLKA